MSFKVINRIPLVRKTLYFLARARVQEKLDQIRPMISKSDKVLDVGCGNCVMAEQLLSAGYVVLPIDIANNSVVPSVSPVIFDGSTIPFKDKEFDYGLLVTVLHHIPHPEETLKEVARVTKKILVIEEVYSNTFTKYLTFFIDSLFNFEFTNHPHTNKTEREWEQTFEELGLKVIKKKRSQSLLLLQRVFYQVSC